MITRLTWDDVLIHKGADPHFSSAEDHALFKARYDKMMEEYSAAPPEDDRSYAMQIHAWAMRRFKLYEDAEAKARRENAVYVPFYQEYPHVLAARAAEFNAALAARQAARAAETHELRVREAQRRMQQRCDAPLQRRLQAIKKEQEREEKELELYKKKAEIMAAAIANALRA